MSEERRYKDHEIREIFDLAIREDETQVESFSGLRKWSHLYLHAFIEPTESGHRLRMTDSG